MRRRWRKPRAKHGLTVAEIEDWHERFLAAAENALRALSPLYPWFSEGFDTRDLKETHALQQGLR